MKIFQLDFVKHFRLFSTLVLNSMGFFQFSHPLSSTKIWLEKKIPQEKIVLNAVLSSIEKKHRISYFTTWPHTMYVLFRQNFGTLEIQSVFNTFLSCLSNSSRWQSIISSKNKFILTLNRWLTWSPSCRAPHWPDIGTRRSQTLSPAHSAILS
jgi:hypothetical protein